MNTNLTVAIHTLLCIAYFEKTEKVTSEFIAASTNVNAVIIRKTLKKMQLSNLIKTKAGVGGSTLCKKTNEITLLDVYKAVSEEDENRSVFHFHENPNPDCPVGRNFTKIMNAPLTQAQNALEEELSKTSIKDLLEGIIN